MKIINCQLYAFHLLCHEHGIIAQGKVTLSTIVLSMTSLLSLIVL